MKRSNAVFILYLCLLFLEFNHLQAQTLQVSLSSDSKVNRTTKGGTATIFFDSSIKDLNIVCTEEDPNESIIKINDHQWFVNIDVNKDIETDGVCYRNYLLKCSASAEYCLTTDAISPNQVLYYTITLPNELEPKLLEAKSRGITDVVNRLIVEGDSYTARLIALSVLPKDMLNPDRPYTIEAERALRIAMKYNSAIIPYTEDKTNSFSVNEKSVVFCPNDSIIAYTVNNKICILDAFSGVELFSFEGHTGRVYKALFSNDGNLLCSMSWDRSVRIWDINKRTEIQRLVIKFKGGVIPDASFSPDGKHVSTSGWDNYIRIWDVKTGEVIDSIKATSGTTYSVAYSPDGKYVLANADPDGKRIIVNNEACIYMWDLKTKQLIRKFQGGKSGMTTFSPDGKLLLSSSFGLETPICIWDVKTGQLLHKLNHEGNIYSALFSPDGKVVISASSFQTIKIWDVKTGKLLRELDKHSAPVTYASFSNDNKRIVSISEDNTIRIWDNYPSKDEIILLGHGNTVSSVSFSPDGKYVASGSFDETIRIWDFMSEKELLRFQSNTSRMNRIHTIAYSPDGNNIVSASSETETILWDVNSKKIVGTNYGGREGDFSASFSPDGKYVIMGTPLRVLSKDDLTDIRQMENPPEAVYSVSCSPSGDIILTTGNKIIIWNISTGKIVRTIEGHTKNVLSAVYSADGKYIVSASADSTIRIWEATTGFEIKRLIGHSGSVYSAVFSPDGNRVASASEDRTVRIWDVQSEINIGVLEGHKREVISVAYSPDGRYIASSSCDKTVRVWDSFSLQDIICFNRNRFKNRPLTVEEKAKYNLE